MKFRVFILTIVSLSLFISSSCQNKYRPRFYLIEESARQELTPDNNYYLMGYKISLRPIENMIMSGDGAVLITNHRSIHPEKKEMPAGIITVRGEMTERIAVNLPTGFKNDSLDIADQSICILIGRFELADSLNLYYCREGYLRIDSVKSSTLYAYLSGKYFNINNDSLQFAGELRARKQK